MKITGDRIRRCRMRIRITPDQAATASGVNPERLQQLEAGIVDASRDEIISLALVLGVDANDLRPGTTEPRSFPAGLSTDEKIALIFDDAPPARGKR